MPPNSAHTKIKFFQTTLPASLNELDSPVMPAGGAPGTAMVSQLISGKLMMVHAATIEDDVVVEQGITFRELLDRNSNISKNTTQTSLSRAQDALASNLQPYVKRSLKGPVTVKLAGEYFYLEGFTKYDSLVTTEIQRVCDMKPVGLDINAIPENIVTELVQYCILSGTVHDSATVKQHKYHTYSEMARASAWNALMTALRRKA